MVFDDLHWSDDATVQLLGPLVEAVASDAVAIVGAYRSDELPRAHLLRPLRARLRHQRQVVEVELGPLRVTGVAELVTALLRRPADPDMVRAIGARTEGVPFFIEELTAALDLSGRLVRDGACVGLARGDESAVTRNCPRRRPAARVGPRCGGAGRARRCIRHGHRLRRAHGVRGGGRCLAGRS